MRGRSMLSSAVLVGLVTLALAGPIGAQSPSPGPSGAASPSVPPAPAIVWDSGLVRLTADAIRITGGGQVFTGQVPQVSIHSDPGDATYRTLEVEWIEQDREQRLYLYLAADKTSWWATEIRTRDGATRAEWVTYPGPAWKMPIGGTYHGDVRLRQGAFSLEIDGLTLRAFSPDTLPAQVRFCRPAIAAGTGDNVDPTAPGQPLADTGIRAMTPAQARALLASLGLCYTFRFEYGLSGGSAFSELWCDAPPGVLDDLLYGSDGQVIVFTHDPATQLHSPRPQPPFGWGC